MALLNTIWRLRRSEASLLLLASLLVLLSVPATAPDAVFMPQTAQAVLLLLGSEISGEVEVTAQSPLSSAPPAKKRDAARIASLQLEATPRRPHPLLENHEAAKLAGVRTNRRLI